MLIFIVLLTFTSLALGVMSVYWLFSREQGTLTARLESMDPALALVENNPMTTMAERVAEPLNRIVPISAIEAEKLQKQLMQAGYRASDAPMAFHAIQVSLVVAIPSIVMTLYFILGGNLNRYLIWGLLGSAIGLPSEESLEIEDRKPSTKNYMGARRYFGLDGRRG